MPEAQPPPRGELHGGVANPALAADDSVKRPPPAPPLAPPAPKPVILADLNVDPPDSEGEDCPVAPIADSSTRSSNDVSNLIKNTVAAKDPDPVESGDVDQQGPGASMSREEKVSSLKAGLVHVARKMPKNAHAHFFLGLMYQRLGQPHKAILAFEKSSEILLQDEEEVRRHDLISLVRMHHAQCVLQTTIGDSFDKELEAGELDDILLNLKNSVQSDAKQAGVWNTLGLILLRTGRLQSAVSILSSLLTIAPDCLDSLAILGIAHLQSGNLELSAKCFQDLVLKDQNHPAALIDYATILLCKYGTIIAGPGASAGEGPYPHQVEALTVAKECLMAAAKADPKTASPWVNLANAYDVAGEHRNSKRCLEQAAKLEPHQMPARYAIAIHRIREAERLQHSTEQLLWAGNEMATVLKECDPAVIDLPIAWAGLAMAHKAQHEIAAAFETEQLALDDAEERALCTLKQVIHEDPDDAVHWHQLGLHNLSALQFNSSVKFFKAAVARDKNCNYTWSNLGIALQLSDDPSPAETVYKRALSLSSTRQAHAILSNLGSLYRQQRRFEHARRALLKSLDLCPGYAPANNNLGLVFVAEGRWNDAISAFEKALRSDPSLDAAKSNTMKAAACLESLERQHNGTRSKEGR